MLCGWVYDLGNEMTGFDSKRQAAMDKLVEIQEELGMYDDQKPEQEPVAWGFRHHDGAIYDCISPEAHADCEGEYNVPLYTTPPKQEPRNFCPRCGKRTPDLTTIHTCTPPLWGNT